jgi:hypothetical protein
VFGNTLKSVKIKRRIHLPRIRPPLHCAQNKDNPIVAALIRQLRRLATQIIPFDG